MQRLMTDKLLESRRHHCDRELLVVIKALLARTEANAPISPCRPTNGTESFNLLGSYICVVIGASG